VKPLLLLLAAASFAGIGLNSDETEKEIEKLQGNWELVSCQMDGTPSKEYGLDELQLAIAVSGGKIRLHVGCAGAPRLRPVRRAHPTATTGLAH
jgi:hypothetical protein